MTYLVIELKQNTGVPKNVAFCQVCLEFSLVKHHQNKILQEVRHSCEDCKTGFAFILTAITFVKASIYLDKVERISLSCYSSHVGCILSSKSLRYISLDVGIYIDDRIVGQLTTHHTTLPSNVLWISDLAHKLSYCTKHSLLPIMEK